VTDRRRLWDLPLSLSLFLSLSLSLFRENVPLTFRPPDKTKNALWHPQTEEDEEKERKKVSSPMLANKQTNTLKCTRLGLKIDKLVPV
jgi:hypothetical protein